MAVLLSSDRKEILSKATRKLLAWALDSVPEYRRFYRVWCKEVREGKVLPHEIQKVKTLKGKFIFRVIIRPGDITAGDPDEISKAWIRQEQRRFAKQVTAEMYTRQERWRKTIGFYPLVNPETGENFSRMYHYINRRFGKGFFLPTVEVLNFPMKVLYGRRARRERTKKNPRKYSFNPENEQLPLLPARLKIAVNCQESKDLIKEEIDEIVQCIKEEYKIPQRRPQVDAELEFKASFLKRLGVKRDNVQKRLTPQKFENRDQREAFRKRLNRVLDKVFKTAA